MAAAAAACVRESQSVHSQRRVMCVFVMRVCARVCGVCAMCSVCARASCLKHAWLATHRLLATPLHHKNTRQIRRVTGYQDEYKKRVTQEYYVHASGLSLMHCAAI